MLFQHVAIAGLAHIDAPRRLSSDEINARLKPTLDRLGIKTDVLGDIAGIHARRLWDGDVQVMQVTDITERVLQVRCLASARSAPVAFDLRCEIREKLMAFMRDECREALPRDRVDLDREDRSGLRLKPETA